MHKTGASADVCGILEGHVTRGCAKSVWWENVRPIAEQVRSWMASWNSPPQVIPVLSVSHNVHLRTVARVLDIQPLPGRALVIVALIPTDS